MHAEKLKENADIFPRLAPLSGAHPPFYSFSDENEAFNIPALYELETNPLFGGRDRNSFYVSSITPAPRGRRHVAVQQSAPQTAQGAVRL